MKYSNSNICLQKSLEAAKAAIELYNKPVFPYRDESFAILMINAWELLLKAKRIKSNNNRMSSIYVKEKVKNKNGAISKKEVYKRNRSGNCFTLSLFDLIKLELTDNNLISNLTLLSEIRDNAIHCFNKAKITEKHYMEIICATISSYKTVLALWFSYDISDENMFTIPVGFNLPKEYDLSDVRTKEERNILKYISEQRNGSDNNSDFDIALNIELRFIKSKDKNAQRVYYDQTGLPIYVDSEEKFKKKYPMDFEILKKKLKERYPKLKLNSNFWKYKKELESNPLYAGTRYLDYHNKKGIKKVYYSTEIFKEFDKRYKEG